MEDSSLSIIQYKFQTDMEVVGLDASMTQAILAWAAGSSDNTSSRFKDLVNDKSRIVGDFLCFVGKSPDLIMPADVQAYQIELEKRNLAAATVYASLSRISAFYGWMMASPDLAARIHRNPVDPVRPKAPKAYQTDSTKALSEGEATALLNHVRLMALSGDLTVKRDYAMLLMYFLTGMRREEVCSLKFGDIILDSIIKISGRVKGGEIVTRQLADSTARVAIEDYLVASNRKNLQPDEPLWTRHDRSGKPGEPLTSHAFVKNLKRYAMEVGIDHIHLHQTRHTFAMIVADETGSLVAAQDALGHKNAAVTQIYVRRLGTKKDKYSQTISNRLSIKDDHIDD